jgi:hypothetical protein
MQAARVEIKDLNANGDVVVGLGGPGLIELDDNAAGYGWYVDSTPGDDTEFTSATGPFEVTASAGPASGRMDLLTVVMHELGHVIGYDSYGAGINEHDLMAGYLDVGTRRLPTSGAGREEASTSASPVQMGSSASNDVANASSVPSIVLADRGSIAASTGGDAVAAASDAGSPPPALHSNDESSGTDDFFSSLAGLSLPDLFV